MLGDKIKYDKKSRKYEKKSRKCDKKRRKCNKKAKVRRDGHDEMFMMEIKQ